MIWVFDDFLKLVKKQKAIDVSSTKKNLELVMKWRMLSFTPKYLTIESYCPLTKTFQLIVLKWYGPNIKISEMSMLLTPGKSKTSPVNLVTSIFFRKKFSSILLLLKNPHPFSSIHSVLISSKLRLGKQCNVLIICFLKNLLTFERINIMQLLERPFFSFHTMFIFSFFIKVV